VLRRKKRTTLTANHVVLAAGTYNTQKLLFKMRDTGTLPGLSDRSGVLTRHQLRIDRRVPAIVLKVSPDLDLTFTKVAITSVDSPDLRHDTSKPGPVRARVPTRWCCWQT